MAYDSMMPGTDEELDPRALRRARLAALALLLLGGVGVAIGSLVPEAGTELLVGALLVVLAVRGLIVSREPADRTRP
ncbi:MAG: hypothetical protein U0270_12230 [Labilithrix sp.]